MSLELKTGSGLTGLGIGSHAAGYGVASTIGSVLGTTLLVAGGVLILSGIVGLFKKKGKAAKA